MSIQKEIVGFLKPLKCFLIINKILHLQTSNHK